MDNGVDTRLDDVDFGRSTKIYIDAGASTQWDGQRCSARSKQQFVRAVQEVGRVIYRKVAHTHISILQHLLSA